MFTNKLIKAKSRKRAGGTPYITIPRNKANSISASTDDKTEEEINNIILEALNEDYEVLSGSTSFMEINEVFLYEQFSDFDKEDFEYTINYFKENGAFSSIGGPEGHKIYIFDADASTLTEVYTDEFQYMALENKMEEQHPSPKLYHSVANTVSIMW